MRSRPKKRTLRRRSLETSWGASVGDELPLQLPRLSRLSSSPPRKGSSLRLCVLSATEAELDARGSWSLLRLTQAPPKRSTTTTSGSTRAPTAMPGRTRDGLRARGGLSDGPAQLARVGREDVKAGGRGSTWKSAGPVFIRRRGDARGREQTVSRHVQTMSRRAALGSAWRKEQRREWTKGGRGGMAEARHRSRPGLGRRNGLTDPRIRPGL